jgi:hypothetical protein
MRFGVLLAIAACGPTSRAPAHVEPVARADGGIAVAPAAGPTDAECSELIAHALALGVAADREPPPPETQAKIRAGLEADFMAGCKALTTRQVHCGLAATTTAALQACQPSLSSSTSNSSVAPPGITPPAPRAP